SEKEDASESRIDYGQGRRHQAAPGRRSVGIVAAWQTNRGIDDFTIVGIEVAGLCVGVQMDAGLSKCAAVRVGDRHTGRVNSKRVQRSFAGKSVLSEQSGAVRFPFNGVCG